MAELVSIGLTLDTRQLEQAATRATQALRQLQQAGQQTQTTLTGTGGASSAASQEMNRLSQSASRASGAMSELGRSLLGLAAGVLGVRAVADELGRIVDVSIKLQQQMTGLSVVLGGEQAGAQGLQFLRSEAERLGLVVNDLAPSFVKLAAATRGTIVEGEGTRKIFTGISEAMVTLGGTSEQTQRALVAIQQSFAKGKLSAEEFTGQLGDALPHAAGVAQRATGHSMAELLKAMEEGRLAGETLAEFWKRFAAQLSYEAAPAIAKMSQSAAAELNRLENSTNELRQAIGEGLLPAVADIARAFADLIRGSKELAHELGPVLGDVLRYTAVAALEVANAFTQTGKTIAAVMVLASEGFEGFKIAIDDAAKSHDYFRNLQQQILNPPKPSEFVGPPEPPAQPPQFGGPLKFGAPTKEHKPRRAKVDRSEERFDRLEGQAMEENRQALTRLIEEQAREFEQLQLTNEAYKELIFTRTLAAASLDGEVSATRALWEARQADIQALQVQKKATEEQIAAARQLTQFEEQQRDTLERLRLSREDYDDLVTRRQLAQAGVGQEDPRYQETLERAREIRIRSDLENYFQGEGSLQDNLDKAKSHTEVFATFFVDTLVNATDIAKRGFEGFADSVISSLQRIALQRFVLPQLEKWIDFGVQALKTGGAAVAGAGEGGSGALGGGGALQHGGPATAGQPYIVGERGPELFIPKQSGTVVPGGRGLGATINVYVQGVQDAQSFVRSKGEVRFAMQRAWQSAQGAL